MISSVSWVRKGAAKEIPDKFKANEGEYKAMMSKLGSQVAEMKISLENAKNTMDQNQQDEAKNALEMAKKAANAIADSAKDEGAELSKEDKDFMKEFDLDNYDSDEEPTLDRNGDAMDMNDSSDEDDEESETKSSNKLKTDLASLPLFSKIDGLLLSQQNQDDPYITPPKDGEMDEEQEELEEMRILPTDNLILATKTEDDISSLEVLLYEEEEDNLYVHHDIMLSSFPLCVEWMDYGINLNTQEASSGNFAAIGTFDPEIEIWDLDIVDSLYPTITLGEDKDTTRSKSIFGQKQKVKSQKGINDERHVDAVMCLSWNKLQRNLLASGSADTTIKIWDITRPEKAMRSLTPHKDKVQSINWHPEDMSVLLSGAYDQRCCILDVRSPEKVSAFKVSADVECVQWDPHHAERFYVSTEDGIVKCFDARTGLGKKAQTESIFTINAHDSAVSGLAVSLLQKGLLATGSSDNTVKIWNIDDNNKVKCIGSKDLGVGSIFTCAFSPDSPRTLSVAGSKGKVIIWNIPDKY